MALRLAHPDLTGPARAIASFSCESRDPLLRETVGHHLDLPRYPQILTTLVRYGYHDVISALHLEGIVRPIERVATGVETALYDRPHRLRLVCEDLGPTFVKLG